MLDVIGVDDDGARARRDPRVHQAAARGARTPREKRILLLRFFSNMTQSQIADEIGVSQMHVSRLLTRTLDQLRASLDEAQPSYGQPGAAVRSRRSPPRRRVDAGRVEQPGQHHERDHGQPDGDRGSCCRRGSSRPGRAGSAGRARSGCGPRTAAGADPRRTSQQPDAVRDEEQRRGDPHRQPAAARRAASAMPKPASSTASTSTSPVASASGVGVRQRRAGEWAGRGCPVQIVAPPISKIAARLRETWEAGAGHRATL